MNPKVLFFGALFLIVATTSSVFASYTEQQDGRLPKKEYNLSLKAPVVDWYEGIPIGNGKLGALIWGEKNKLVVKLDRLDVWDERDTKYGKTDEFTWKTLQKYVKEENFARIHEVFDNQYHSKPPTHVAIGKLELELPEGVNATVFQLDLADAEAIIDYSDGKSVTSFVSATQPVIMVHLPYELKGKEFIAPGANDTWVDALGYPSPVFGEDKESLWYTQKTTAEGPEFAVYAKYKVVKGNTLIAITITMNGDYMEEASEITTKALKQGYKKLFASHKGFWTDFWETSSISIPDDQVAQHYYFTRYLLGSSSRPGYPAMATLQGVWPEAGKQFVYFKNNVHGDLEPQVQYSTYQTSGNFEEGGAFFEYLWERLPVFREYAEDFFETGGANVPSVMTYGGKATGGWPQYTNHPTLAGWYGWLFYQHWRYTQDEEFLATRAYPWCAEIAKCWEELLVPDSNGVLKLPLSASSEVFDNTPRAWLTPNCNYDLDLMRVHLLALAEMAMELGKEEESRRWTKLAGSVGDNHVDDENALMWSEDEPVTYLHRHFAHSMSIHPFNLITIDGSDREREIIEGTMESHDRLGVDANFEGDYAGFSFPWMSQIKSRVGQGDDAYLHLKLFLDGFIIRNGFHMNNNQGKTLAYGHGFYFTVEANMLANQATHDMLIQSWAPTIGEGEAGIIRIFPAMPSVWDDASFEDLRAEGGFRVSAVRENHKTTQFKIVAGTDGLLRIRDNFGGRVPKWKGGELKKVGDNYEAEVSKGDVIKATF